MTRWRRPKQRFSTSLILLGLLAAILGATATLFVWPAKNTAAKVDAIVVLGGQGDRLAKGAALTEAGYASVLVDSIPPFTRCPEATAREQLICFHPDPASTKGEAEAVTRLAAEHHWTSLLVVSSIPQTTRARIRFDRCYRGTLLFDPVSPGGIASWAYSLIYEWGALAKALTIQRGC